MLLGSITGAFCFTTLPSLHRFPVLGRHSFSLLVIIREITCKRTEWALCRHSNRRGWEERGLRRCSSMRKVIVAKLKWWFIGEQYRIKVCALKSNGSTSVSLTCASSEVEHSRKNFSNSTYGSPMIIQLHVIPLALFRRMERRRIDNRLVIMWLLAQRS